MKMTGLKISIFFLLLLLITPSSPSAALKVTGDFDYTSSEDNDNGDKSTSDLSEENFRLTFNKYINPFLSYDLFFSASRKDKDSEEADGTVNNRKETTLEPGIDLLLKNPLYELRSGYKIQEETDTDDDTTMTSDYFYSRFMVSPVNLPSFDAEYNIETDKGDENVDSRSERYLFRSFYELPSDAVEFRMNLNYTHTTDEDPFKVTFKSEASSLSGNYRLSHSRRFLNEKANAIFTYNGNFSQTDSKTFSSVTGDVLFQRPGVGLYDQGEDNLPLSSVGTKSERLTDSFLDVSTTIGLSDPGGEPVGDAFQNIGIFITEDKAVKYLHVYVNQNLTADILRLASSWKIYSSISNTAGSWSEVGGTGVPDEINVLLEDAGNNIYRIEIELPVETRDSYIKIINQIHSGVPGVFVTEIEAYGIEVVPVSGVLESSNNSISQRISLFSSYRPMSKFLFTLNFSINRSESNPSSVLDSFQKIISSIYSKSEDSNDSSDYSSTTIKNLSLSGTWFTNRFLTSDFRAQFNQTYNDELTTDIASNTYSLNFIYLPIQHLDANLSITRSEQFKLEEKNTINDSAILSVTTLLHRDLNMVTDIGYTRSQTLTDGKESSSKYINGIIDTDLTKRISCAFRYNFSWKTNDEEQTSTQGGWATVTYRPGRFINVSGDIRYATSEDITTIQEILTLDWRPIPVVQVSSTYRHSDSSPDNFTKDSFFSSATWNIKRFVDLKMSYFYEMMKGEDEIMSQSVNVGMNFRF